MSGSILNEADGLQSVQDEIIDNNNRLVTEAIMRNQNSNLWKSMFNKLDDEQLLNLRDFTNRPYAVGECMVYDNGSGKLIYQAVNSVTGTPFNPADWVVIGGGTGVDSFNTRQGNVFPEIDDYNASQIKDDSTLNKGYVKDALEYLEDVATSTAIATFFVNSNNPNTGNGSITNPFNSVDLAYNTIVGTGTPNNPELVPVGELANLIVQGGDYSTSKNLLINRVAWSFDNNTKLEYLGTAYLFEVNSTVYNLSGGYTNAYVLGNCEFLTSTGGFVKTTSGSLGNGVTLFISGFDFRSQFVSSNPVDKVLFDLHDNTDTWQYSPNMVMILPDGAEVISYTQTIIRNGSGTQGRKRFTVKGGTFYIGTSAHNSTQSVDSRIFDLNRSVIADISFCSLNAGKSDYLINLGGATRDVSFDHVNFVTSQSSSLTKSKGWINCESDLSLNNLGGGSTAILGIKFGKCDNFLNNWTDSEIVQYLGAGTLDFLYFDKCTMQGEFGANVNPAKSISFEGNGANPKPYAVTNSVNGNQQTANIPEDLTPSVDNLGLDASGNIVKTGGTTNSVTVTKETLLNGFSVATAQNPTGTNTPLQIEFGVAQGSGGDAVQLLANGGVQINEPNDYEFQYELQYGRTGSTGVSRLFARLLVDGVQVGRTSEAELDNGDVIIPTSSTFYLQDLTAGQVVTLEIVRDSTGNNSGGLLQDSNSVGWNDSTTAEVTVRRIVSTGNATPIPAPDVDAIHVNAPNEIDGITEKLTPVASDLLVIEDSADSNNKKKIQIGNLPSSGGGSTKLTSFVSYVKAGTVNNVIALNTHSAFSSVSGHYHGTDKALELYAITLNAHTSVATAGGNFDVQVRYDVKNSGTPHTALGGTLLHSENMLTTAGAVATTYNTGVKKTFTPVALVQDRVYFVDVSSAGFWSLTDVEIVLHIREV